MLSADGMIPVAVSSAGSRTSMKITGAWVGEGDELGRAEVIFFVCQFLGFECVFLEKCCMWQFEQTASM